MSAESKSGGNPLARPKAGLGKTMRARIAPETQARHRNVAKPKRQILLHRVTSVSSGRRSEMLKQIKKGLPFKTIEMLEVAYCTSRKELSSVLSIPTSTLTRRQKSGRLLADESDRVVRLARLKDAVLKMTQYDDEAAIAWLHTPLDILGQETPLQHASTEMGARDVEDLIGRLGHGVFS